MIKLYKHQEDALKATTGKNRVAYYLDMGLGKTFVGSEKMKQLNAPYNMVVCQKSKIDDWCNHFKEFYPNLKVIKYSKPREIPPNSVIVINYDLVWRRTELQKLNNFTLMLDECTYIKNPTSKRTKFICRKLNFTNIILLSGTPCAGKYEELLTQCHLLGWNITKTSFWNTYVKYKNIDMGGFKIPLVLGYKNVDRLKRKLRELGAVFMKTDDVIELPSQTFIIEKVKSTKDYKTFLRDRLLSIGEKELVGDTTLTYLLYLRQLSTLYNKNKYDRLKDVLEGTEDRVIIFYNFTQEMENIKDICDKLKKPVSIINGNQKDLSAYNESMNSVTLVQYQAGAMGLNLQKSNKIIYFSLTQSSDLFEQSKKRTHRIGQDKKCMYWVLIAENTIDENIYKSLLKRENYTNKLFEEDFND